LPHFRALAAEMREEMDQRTEKRGPFSILGFAESSLRFWLVNVGEI
jgi:hypothetical protein